MFISFQKVIPCDLEFNLITVVLGGGLNLNIYITLNKDSLGCDLVGFEFIVALNCVTNFEIYLDKKDGPKALTLAFFETLRDADSEMFMSGILQTRQMLETHTQKVPLLKATLFRMKSVYKKTISGKIVCKKLYLEKLSANNYIWKKKL